MSAIASQLGHFRSPSKACPAVPRVALRRPPGRRAAFVSGVGMALVMSGCALAPPDEPYDGGSGALAREIEEADIVKVQDGFLYIANPYTGLRIVDASVIEAPVMRGRVPLGGRAVELFVRDNLVFVFTAADFFYCAGEPTPFSAGDFDAQVLPDYAGSRLWVVDVADADAPAVAHTFDFDGYLSETRRVGDVIYATGTVLAEDGTDLGCTDTCRYASDGYCQDGGSGSYDYVDCELGTDCTDCGPRLPAEVGGSAVFVTSINIADPDAISEVDTESFEGAGLYIHVSEQAIYVMGDDPSMDEITSVTYVDISDPDGDVIVRDQFRVPGEVASPYFADEYLGTFRIVTEQDITNLRARAIALYTYDVTDPDDVTRLSRLSISGEDSLRAVRFDGERGYVVADDYYRPLYVLDLSDPADPQVSGELSVPGYSTHLVPLGDRLVGVGFDTRAGTRPAVVLYDVSDPTAPRQLDRIIVGERWTSNTGSSATVDEKALRVIAEAGLILMPYSRFDRDTGEFTDAVYLLRLGEVSLGERGTIEHRGVVRRADLLDERLWILSDEAFQTVDIDDLDAPAALAMLEIISDQELLDAGLWSCAQAARTQATSVTPSWDYIDGCGYIGMVPMLAMFGGLGLMRRAGFVIHK